MPKGKKDKEAIPPGAEEYKGDGTNKFVPGDKVLVDNHNMIYKAVIKMIKKKSDEDDKDAAWFYFIHYDGWNKKWDAWVAENIMMAEDDENTAKMLETNRKTKEALAKKKQKKSDDGGKDRQDERASKKRKMDQQRELEEFLEPQVRVPIPFVLKKTLVDDWEWVTRSNLLVPLPRTPSVQTILKQYLDGKLKRKAGAGANTSLNIHQEFADGLQDYFDRALGTILLYRHERDQYQHTFRDQNPKGQASAHYGAEHLLRLFVRLPTLLANTDLSDTELSVLQNKISDFLKFLVKNHEDFFCTSYEKKLPGQTTPAVSSAKPVIVAEATKSDKDEAATKEKDAEVAN